MFVGMLNSLFFASFGINTPSPKSRDGWELLEPILVFFIHHFVNTSGTCRWWLGQSNLFCILTPAEISCTHDQKIERCEFFSHTGNSTPPPNNWLFWIILWSNWQHKWRGVCQCVTKSLACFCDTCVVRMHEASGTQTMPWHASLALIASANTWVMNAWKASTGVHCCITLMFAWVANTQKDGND